LVEKFYNCPNYQNREYMERHYQGFMKNKTWQTGKFLVKYIHKVKRGKFWWKSF
jgi:hypothetical protein